MPTSNSALRLIAIAVWCLSLATVVACAKSPALHGAEQTTSVSEAEDALTAAEEELGDLFDLTRREYDRAVTSQREDADSQGPRQGNREPPSSAPAAPSVAPTPLTAPRESPHAADSGYDSSEQLRRCRYACAALLSIERAAARVCELGGDDSDACARARHRLRYARLWVWRRCPICAVE